MTAELDVLRDAVERLEAAGMPYMLTGSIALSYYAQPRMTRDIDLVVELQGRSAGEVAAVFAPDYYISEDDVARALNEHGMFNVLHLQQLVKVDLIVRKDTDYRRREFERRRKVALPGFQAWIVSGTYLHCLPRAQMKPIFFDGQHGWESTNSWSDAEMQDTTPEVRELLADRYRALGPEERVRMCTEMFDSARLLVEASLPPGLDDRARRKLVCERFYGALAERVFPV